MAAFVAKYGENVVSVGFEVGPLSTWLYHELKGAGLPVVCIDSWRARAALFERTEVGAPQQDGSDRCSRIGRFVAGRFPSSGLREELCGARGADDAEGARYLGGPAADPESAGGRILSGDCWKQSAWSSARVRAGGLRCWSRTRSPADRRCGARSSLCWRSGKRPARPPPRCIGSCGRWPGPTPTVAG
jgi:hypothetical protein